MIELHHISHISLHDYCLFQYWSYLLTSPSINSSLGTSNSSIHGSNWLVSSNATPGYTHFYHFNPEDLTTVRVLTNSTGGGFDSNNLLLNSQYLPTSFGSGGGHFPRQCLSLTCRERSSSTPNVSNNLIPPNQQKSLFTPSSLGKVVS